MSIVSFKEFSSIGLIIILLSFLTWSIIFFISFRNSTGTTAIPSSSIRGEENKKTISIGILMLFKRADLATTLILNV